MTALEPASAGVLVKSPADPPPIIESQRFRLARLAREAALTVPGVVGTDPGPLGLFVTVGGGQRLEGVICAATSTGSYDISLRLTCGMVPLLPLGDSVRAAVGAVAAAQRVSLERVTVHIADVAGGV
jgi:hypothetical protein